MNRYDQQFVEQMVYSVVEQLAEINSTLHDIAVGLQIMNNHLDKAQQRKEK